MKRLFATALAVLTAAGLASCARSDVIETTAPTAVAATTKQEEITTEPKTVSVVTEELTEETTKKKTKETKPTEPTEKPTKKSAKKPTKAVPTQGKTKPNTHVVVTYPKGVFHSSDLIFRKGSISLELGEDWEDALKDLKKQGDVNEISGKRTEHEYSNFTVTTYKDEDDEYIEKIEITDDTLATPRGVRIGDFASRLRKIYGDPIKRTKTAYVYGNEDESLVFTYENNMIDSIYYKIIF
ncbi:MAG: hypothetical protein IIU14_01245 [Ruminococcus sp.]|nr:hypothetical protein [Ruminococcus sp.]